MVQITDLTAADRLDRYPQPGYRIDGVVSARQGSTDGFPLWLVGAELDDGASIQWVGEHGEEAAYVLTGRVTVDGRDCPERGAVIVEQGARPVLRAIGGPARILPLGRPPERAAGANGADRGASVHVVGPRGTYARVEEGRDSHYYADSTCATCDVTLLYTSRNEQYESVLHSHSADELIHLLWGEMRVGRHVLGPGSTLAIRADAPYRFRSGPDGFGFLNFRSGPSTMAIGRAKELLVEGGAANGFEPVMDLL